MLCHCRFLPHWLLPPEPASRRGPGPACFPTAGRPLPRRQDCGAAAHLLRAQGARPVTLGPGRTFLLLGLHTPIREMGCGSGWGERHLLLGTVGGGAGLSPSTRVGWLPSCGSGLLAPGSSGRWQGGTCKTLTRKWDSVCTPLPWRLRWDPPLCCGGG